MANKQRKPKLRFKEFTDTWQQHKLGELGIATSGTSIESEFEKGGKYKVISIGSYSENSTYNDQGIRARLSNKTKKRILNKDDLTMMLNDKTASGRIIGRVLIIDKSDLYVFNQRTQRIEPYYDKYDATFLYEMLNAPQIRNRIFKQSQGNTQIYVNWSTIKEIEYLIPNIEEQVKLGHMFKQIDNLITLHQHKYEKVVNIKKAFLETMFPKNGEKVPRVRFKEFTDNWRQSKLDELGRIQTGNTPSTSIKEYYSEDGMQWVTPTDITSNIIKTTERKLSNIGAKVGRIVPANTILVTCIASIGKNAIVTERSAFNQQINSLTPFFEKHDPYFLLTDSINWSNTMKKGAGGLTFQIVNKAEFSEIETNIPSKKQEEEKIGNLFKNIDNLISLHQRKLEKLKNIKNSLLDKMFV